MNSGQLGQSPLVSEREHNAGPNRDTAMLESYARNRDPLLKERLVRRYLGLARLVASRFESHRVPFDDLNQVAAIGLLKALDRYDPARGVAFSTYAVPTIAGELKRHLRDHSWSVRPPRGLLELAMRIRAVEADLTRELGRPPAIGEIAGALGISVEEALEGVQAADARDGTSLDEPWSNDEGAGALGDSLGHDDAGFDRVEDAITFDLLSEVLDERERRILWLRFHAGLMQREIGERVGCSQMHVSRLIRGALRKLTEAAEGDVRLAEEPDGLQALLS
jgi:RNA polymerase sigma-B factor